MIDYGELQQFGVKGEGLENLTRVILKQLQLAPVWSGRGADQGKDLIATEIPMSPIRGRTTKWLVSCKDYFQSGKSVPESDLPNITDKLKQHDADAFLLVTTTTAATSTKAQLDSLNERGIMTMVWDRTELDSILLKPENRTIVKQFFPNSYLQIMKLEPVNSALPPLATLPSEIIDKITELLAPYARNLRFGNSLWPDDPGRAKEFESLCENLLLCTGNVIEIAEKANPRYMDVILRVLNILETKKLHDIAFEFAEQLVRQHPHTDCSLNCFQYLLDSEISPTLIIELTQYIGEEALEFLYFDEIEMFVRDEILGNPSNFALWSKIDLLSGYTSIIDLGANSIQFLSEGKRVEFRGEGYLECDLTFDQETVGSYSPNMNFIGYFDESGIYLLSADADTSSFYK